MTRHNPKGTEKFELERMFAAYHIPKRYWYVDIKSLRHTRVSWMVNPGDSIQIPPTTQQKWMRDLVDQPDGRAQTLVFASEPTDDMALAACYAVVCAALRFRYEGSRRCKVAIFDADNFEWPSMYDHDLVMIHNLSVDSPPERFQAARDIRNRFRETLTLVAVGGIHTGTREGDESKTIGVGEVCNWYLRIIPHGVFQLKGTYMRIKRTAE